VGVTMERLPRDVRPQHSLVFYHQLGHRCLLLSWSVLVTLPLLFLPSKWSECIHSVCVVLFLSLYTAMCCLNNNVVITSPAVCIVFDITSKNACMESHEQ